ncbi:hypothetical protein Vretifemale_17583, partial [Volvox reticuliferus]
RLHVLPREHLLQGFDTLYCASEKACFVHSACTSASSRQESVMTDAYEDLFSPNKEHCPAASDVLGDESLAHCQQTHAQTKREQWDGRLQAAEQRRQEFRAWLLHRARRGNGSIQKAAERAAAEERRGRRLELLQERLAAAEANRAACLARLQRRAAATSRRREDAAERAAAAAAERTTAAAERLEAELAAAESRRLALREAELERLRAEHELVLSRLVSVRLGRGGAIPQRCLYRGPGALPRVFEFSRRT